MYRLIGSLEIMVHPKAKIEKNRPRKDELCYGCCQPTAYNTGKQATKNFAQMPAELVGLRGFASLALQQFITGTSACLGLCKKYCPAE
jgi:hypothetical protein